MKRNDIKNKNIELLNFADSLRWELKENLHDSITESVFKDANIISSKTIISEKKKVRTEWEVSLDKVVTSRLFGFPIMFFLLAIVFWLTIQGGKLSFILNF